MKCETYAAAISDGDLQHVLSWLADMLEVDRPLTFAINTPADLQLVVVHPHRHRSRPVGLHLMVFVMKRLELNVELRSVSNTSVSALS